MGVTYLLSLLQLDFEQLVHGFFVVQGVHDREVDHSPQVDQVRLSPVFDAFLFFNGCATSSQQHVEASI